MKERLEEQSGREEHFFAISPTLIGGQLMGLFYRAQASIKRCQAAAESGLWSSSQMTD